jgi:polyhydroxyalkanoate synthesis regulator phasin
MRARDLLYLGLGAAFMTRDRIEKELDNLEKQGEMSREEIKKFLHEAKERVQKEQEDLDERVRTKVKEAFSEFGVATKDDIEELKKLISKD